MARALMDEGDAKIEAQDYSGALRAYRAAHTIMNVPTTGIEVARVEAKLGRLVEARKVALEIVAMPVKPAEPKPFVEARAEAKKLSEDLDARIPTVRVEVLGSNASLALEIKIDGVLVPVEEAKAPFPVNPGKHHVSASRVGQEAVSKEIAISEAQHISVTLSLGVPSSTGPEVGRRTSPLVYVGFGVGGVGLIAGAVTGGLSLSYAGDVEKVCPGGACPTQGMLDEMKPTNDKALLFANVSNVAFGLGLVGIGVGVAGIFLSGPSKQAEQTSSLPTLKLRVGPNGAAISGQF